MKGQNEEGRRLHIQDPAPDDLPGQELELKKLQTLSKKLATT